MSTVSVYRFRFYSEKTEEMVESNRWRTAESIELLSGEKIDGSDALVDGKWLDAQGQTVNGVHEQAAHFPNFVRMSMRTPEEAAQRWLMGPGE